MAVNDNVTWNDGVPSVASNSAEPVYGHLQIGDLGAEQLRGAAKDLLQAGMNIEEVQNYANRVAEQKMAKEAAITYSRQLNEIHAKYEGLKGMDAVKWQAAVSEETYALRQKIAGGLKNQRTADDFLAMTADRAVGADYAIQSHARVQEQQYTQQLFKSDQDTWKVTLAQNAKNWAVNQGYLLSYLDSVDQELLYNGIKDPTVRRQQRNLAFTEGVGIIVGRLVRDEDAVALRVMMQNLSDPKVEGGQEALTALAVVRPEIYNAAQDLLLKHETADAAAKALNLGREPVGAPTGTGVQSFGSSNRINYNKAIEALIKMRENGEIRDNVRFMSALSNLNSALDQSQKAFAFEVNQHMEALFRVNEEARKAGKGPAAAMDTALKGAGAESYNWLIVNAPEYARKVRTTFELDVYRTASAQRAGSRTRVGQPTDDENLLFIKLSERMSNENDRGFLAELDDVSFNNVLKMLHPKHRATVMKARNDQMTAIAGGKASLKTVLPQFFQIVKSQYASDWKSQATDSDQTARFASAAQLMADWAQEYAERERKMPLPKEVELQTHIYLSQVKIVRDWRPDRTSYVGSAIIAGDIGKYDVTHRTADALRQLKQQWIATRKREIMVRGNYEDDLTQAFKLKLPDGSAPPEVLHAASKLKAAKEARARGDLQAAKSLEYDADKVITLLAESEWKAALMSRPRPRTMVDPGLIEEAKQGALSPTGGITLPGNQNVNVVDQLTSPDVSTFAEEYDQGN